MSDIIKVNPAPNQSTINGWFIPGSDGSFSIDVTATANGNGHGTPLIWATIDLNGSPVEESKHIAWEDGPGSISISTPVSVEKGKIYKISAESGNLNADATGIVMHIARAA
jgi:hypothetical protein